MKRGQQSEEQVYGGKRRTISSILGACGCKSERGGKRERVSSALLPSRLHQHRHEALQTHGISLNQLWYLIIIIILGEDGGDAIRSQAAGRTLLGLVRLGDPPQSVHGFGSELGQDAGDELGELLLLAAAVDGESVGAGGSVDCRGLGESRAMLVVMRVEREAKVCGSRRAREIKREARWGRGKAGSSARGRAAAQGARLDVPLGAVK